MTRLTVAMCCTLAFAACTSTSARRHEVVPDAAGRFADASGASDTATEATPAAELILRGGRLPDGTAVDMRIADGRIAAVLPHDGAAVDPRVRVVDVAGKWLVPGFIDSHVHLSYWPVAESLLKAGVVAAVDLAAPLSALARPVANGLRLRSAGPMITSVGGYPLDSWGSDGYGIPCEDAKTAVTAVDDLVAAGAGVIKIPLGQGRPLPEPVVRAAVARAHERGVKVAVHALSDEAAALGAAVGADILAHTPVEPLTSATVEAWRGRAVISTLLAFGGGASAIANLRLLRAAGVTVVYGTDLGNTRDARIDPREVALLERAGLDGAAIVEAGTAAPARLWAWHDLGTLDVGMTATLIVLAEDPRERPQTLADPLHVIVAGNVVR